MKIQLRAEIKNGVDMPSVNTFGGCDPFVEIRIQKGDPAAKDGDLSAVPKDTARTKARDGDMTPEWNETLELKKTTYGKEMYVNIILWDSNIAKNTPLGYQALCTTDLLSGLKYDPTAEAQQKKEHVAKFTSLLGEGKDLKAIANMSFSYLEVHKFKVTVKKATNLPRVDSIGSIDAFVEVRLVNCDPRQMEYTKSPGNECLWSATTKIVNDNQNPTFGENFQFTCAADPSLYLIFVMSDSGTLGNTPVGQVIVPMKQICSNKMGAEQECKLKLEKLPGWDAVNGLTKASISFSVIHDQAIEA
jgi:Ca2+-dependent lipid-binding protein